MMTVVHCAAIGGLTAAAVFVLFTLLHRRRVRSPLGLALSRENELLRELAALAVMESHFRQAELKQLRGFIERLEKMAG